MAGLVSTMARLARVIAPGMPHHVTQRGNPRQETFFGEDDYQHYLELMALFELQFCRAEQVAIWAHCLMPNRVHLRSSGDTIPNSEKLSMVSPELMSRFRKVVTGWIHDACSCD